MLSAQEELRRESSCRSRNECKDWQGCPYHVSCRRFEGISAWRGEPHCDRVGTLHFYLTGTDRTTGMSGEGNRGDVTGRILSTHKTRRSHIPRRWRTHSRFHPFHPFLNPTNISTPPYTPGAILALTNVPWRVRLTKSVIGISLRHSLRQRLRVLLARVQPLPSLLAPRRISPKTLTIYTRHILTHSL